MNYKESMRNIGRECAKFRKHDLHMTQEDVERESGFSQGTISAFELGNSYSTRLLMWYIHKGFPTEGLSDLMEV